MLLQMSVGDCYDVMRSPETVKFYIYHVLKDRFGHRGRYLVRAGATYGTARVWRLE